MFSDDLGLPCIPRPTFWAAPGLLVRSRELLDLRVDLSAAGSGPGGIAGAAYEWVSSDLSAAEVSLRRWSSGPISSD
eukprot:3823278-Pyramimonas_sp.AAC.3